MRRPRAAVLLLAAVIAPALLGAACGSDPSGAGAGATSAGGAAQGSGPSTTTTGSTSGSFDAGDASAIDAPLDGEDAGDPTTACKTSGAAGHVQVVSAYWAATAAYGEHLAALAPAMQVGHVDRARLASPLPPDVDVILDLYWDLFDVTTHTARADLAQQVVAIAADVAPVKARVRALYLMDEPYVAGHALPRAELEKAIAAIQGAVPGIPTYITFAHHCVDPASDDPVCVVPAASRGIPAGLDWVGFDWYNDSNDPAVAGAHVAELVAPGVDRIALLAPKAKVIVVPEAYTDGNRTEATAMLTLYDYFALAASRPSVFGVDFFLWADVPGPPAFLGIGSLPSVRAATRGFARWVREGCGDPSSFIPITQWYSAAGPDYRYEPWVWDGHAAGYRLDGVAFALARADAPGATPLVHCLVDRGASVDSYLTLDPGCDGAPVKGPGVVVGGIFTSQAPGTTELYGYAQEAPPWDHAYALGPNAVLPPDYTFKYPLGWVYDPSVL